MTVADTVFHVATEFNFEINEAVLKTERLQNAIQGISHAAESALFSIRAIPEFLSSQLGAHLSIGAGLFAAVQSSEKLQKNALSLSSILSNNADKMTGGMDNFNNAMGVSKHLLKDWAQTAQKFSLDEGAFISTAKMLSATLIPMGLAGTNLKGASEMARGLMKSAPILGVDPDQVQGELIRALQGGASMGDTFFRRIAVETKAFEGLRNGHMPGGPNVGGMMQHMRHSSGGSQNGAATAQRFNTMNQTQRFAMLNEALMQFSNNADVNAGNAHLLANRLVALKNQLMGVNGILRPLGEAIVPRINKVFDFLSQLMERLRPWVQTFADKLGYLIDHPQKLYAFLEQMRQLHHDVHLAGEVFATAVALMWKRFIIKTLWTFAKDHGVFPKLGNAFKFLMPNFSKQILEMLSFFKTASFLAKAMTVLTTVFRVFWFILARVATPILLLVGLFQLFSRANAYAHIKDAKAVAEASGAIAVRMASAAKNLYRIFLPFEMMFDDAARAIAPIFSYSMYLDPTLTALEMLGDFFNTLGTTAAYLMSTLNGVMWVIGDDIAHCMNDLYTAFVFIKEIGKIFWEQFKFIGNVLISTISTVVDTLFRMLNAAEFGKFGQIGNIKDEGIAQIKDIWKLPTGPGQDLPKGLFDRKELMPELDSSMTPGQKFDAGFEEFAKRFLDFGAKDARGNKVNASTTNTTIGNVNIRQDFKENMEPDRIAHSLVKVLGDVAKNPTQANGRSYAGNFYGSQK